MPSCGVNVINTPGLIGGVMKIYEDFASLSLEKIFEPAISYAEEGYPVTPQIAKLWGESYEKYKNLNREEFDGFLRPLPLMEGHQELGKFSNLLTWQEP